MRNVFKDLLPVMEAVVRERKGLGHEFPELSRSSSLDDWRRVADALEAKLGLPVIGFNPGFAIESDGRFADVPAWLARRILAC